MQFRVFAIPAGGSPELEEDMNRFLRSHRVVSVQKTLENWDGTPKWCFCVEFLDARPETKGKGKGKGGAERIDYKAVLSEADFAVFSRLRDLRKDLAAKDGVSLYVVCTNANLAEMAKQRPEILSQLKTFPDFSAAKIDKYGQAFLDLLAEIKKENATGGKPD